MATEPRASALQKGDALPFFEVTTLAGEHVRYADLWQKKNVLLVSLPPDANTDDEDYAKELSGRNTEFEVYSAACIITRDRIAGIPSPGLAIADRWGEVQYLASSAAARELPDVAEILDTLDYVQRRCPECEGEWR
jgi:hypothetical protein